MRCMACGADIPPAFVKALELNKCPACDGEIMNEASQELLKELSDALARMPNDPQGVAGWLLSNYRFQKMGDGKPVDKFYRKGGGGSEYDDSNLKIAPSYNEFVKRNDAGHLVARSNELAAQFKGSKNGQIAELASMIQGVGDPYGDNSTSTTSQTDDGPADPEDQKSYLELKQAGYDPFATTAAPISGAMSDLSQAIDPRDVVNLLKSQGENVPLESEVLLAKTEKGRAILQMNEFKRIKAQEAITGGGNGVFRRGG